MKYIFKPTSSANATPWEGVLGEIHGPDGYVCEISNGRTVADAAVNRDFVMALLNASSSQTTDGDDPKGN